MPSSGRGGVVKALVAVLAITPAMMSGAAVVEAQVVDPRLAAAQAFIAEEMPGVAPGLLEAACKDATVMLYYGTWIDAQKKQIEGFRKRFPCVDVKTFTANTGERRERWLAETRAGRHIADIVQETESGLLDQWADGGLLLAFPISNDAAFQGSAKKAPYWYGLRAAMVGAAWNTDLVSEADAKVLADWSGIADPRWKDRAAVVDPSAGGVAYLPWYIWSKLYGPEFLGRIGALRPRIFVSINVAAAALASGDIAVVLNASETGLLPLQQRGAPIRWSMPTPGIGPMTGQAIAGHAPHPNAARLYQEYSFTREGYGLWQKEGGAPVRSGFKDLRPVAAQPWYKLPDTFHDYDRADATKAEREITELYHTHIGRLKK